MLSAFPITWKEVRNSRRHVRAGLAKGMQTGTRSLPNIMKGCHTNLSNQSFLPEAMGSVHVPLNAT